MFTITPNVMKPYLFWTKGSFKGAIGTVIQIKHRYIHAIAVDLGKQKDFLKIAQKSTCIFEKVL